MLEGRKTIDTLISFLTTDPSQDEDLDGHWRNSQAQVSVCLSVFWNVAPCSKVENARRFEYAYCLLNQGDDGLWKL